MIYTQELGRNTLEAVVATRLLTFIWNADGSNMCRVARCCVWVCLWFLQVSPDKYRDNTSKHTTYNDINQNRLKQIRIIKSLTILQDRQIKSRRQNHILHELYIIRRDTTDSPGAQEAKTVRWHHLRVSGRLGRGGAVPSLPHMPSWRAGTYPPPTYTHKHTHIMNSHITQWHKFN
jgi:hypothetical protein